MLQMVGENARKGIPKARSAAAAVQAYIAEHPAPLVNWEEGATIVGILKNPDNSDEDVFETLLSLPQFEDSNLIQTACVVLSMHPHPWDNPRVHALDSLLEAGSPPQEAFRFGLENAGEPVIKRAKRSMPKELEGYLCAGHCIGMARKIQIMRLPDSPVGILCKGVEWELSCGSAYPGYRSELHGEF
jgi:hypothetical protein